MQSRYDTLDKLEASKRLSPDGADWIKLAVDPFHDFAHTVAGYPDTDSSQTVVSCYQYQMDVVAPAALAAGNWDCHIYSLPLANSLNYESVAVTSTWSTATEYAVPQYTPFGPLNIVTGATGAALQPNGAPVATNEYKVLPAVNNQDLCGGISRVIGAGFEVTNTTAEINKQGSVTVYRMPQNSGKNVIALRNNAGTYVTTVSGERWRAPPNSLAEVNLLKGTRTWDAAAGVYTVIAQNSVQNPLTQMATHNVMFDRSASPGAASVALLSPYTTVPAAAASPNASVSANEALQTTPFDTSGAYFTGLSQGTVLTVKVKFYVERAPTFTESTLAVLASPSAGYDVAALSYYSHMLSELPVSTKVHNNASGDWWKACLSVLSKVAGGVGSALNVVMPGAGALGTAIQMAATTAAAVSKAKRRNNPQLPAPKAKPVSKAVSAILPAPAKPGPPRIASYKGMTAGKSK